MPRADEIMKVLFAKPSPMSQSIVMQYHPLLIHQWIFTTSYKGIVKDAQFF